MEVSVMSTEDELITTEEALEQYRVPGWVLEAWHKVGCLDLGRIIYSELRNGVRYWSRGDLRMAMARLLLARSTKEFRGLPHYQGIEDARGQWWRPLKWARQFVSRDTTTVASWAEKPTLLLAGARRKLRSRKTPVYSEGKWLVMWVVHEGDLEEIRANLEARKIIDPVHGPGVTAEEARDLGFPTKNILYEWSSPGRQGIPELAGTRLARWKERRLYECVCRGKTELRVRLHTVFSPEQLRQVLAARCRRAAVLESRGLTDAEVTERFGPLFSGISCSHWRRNCIHLGRALHHWKERRTVARPNGAYEKQFVVNSLNDLEVIAMKIREIDAPYEDSGTGKIYLPVKPFSDLTGYKTSTVEQYYGKDHPALGRPIITTLINRPKGGYAVIRGFLKDDGEKIVAWRKTDRGARAAVIIRSILATGPVLAREAVQLARQAGASALGIEDARRGLGLHLRAPKGLRSAGFYWCLPGQEPPESIPPTSEPPDSPPLAQSLDTASHGRRIATDQSQDAETPRLRGGRPTDEGTWKIYEFCYQKYVTEGKGAATVRSLVNQAFGPNTIKEDAHVRLYARRFAEKHGRPRKHQESAGK
jgi:hypothetical protein